MDFSNSGMQQLFDFHCK